MPTASDDEFWQSADGATADGDAVSGSLRKPMNPRRARVVRAAWRLAGDDAERGLAEADIAESGVSSVEAAVAAVRGLPRNPASQMVWLSIASLMVGAVGALATQAVARWMGNPGPWWTGTGGAVSVPIVMAFTLRRQRRLVTRWMALQRDPRVIGPLADAMAMVSRAECARVAAGLAAALEHCDREGYELVTRRQRQRIADALLAESDETVLSLLRSLVRLEDGGSLPWVERLAAGERRGAGPEVLRAARESLPILREAVARREWAETLLRPAEPSADGLLLRPATGSGAEPAALLRPATADQPEVVEGTSTATDGQKPHTMNHQTR